MRFFHDDSDTTRSEPRDVRAGRAALAALIGFAAVFLIFAIAMFVMVFLR